MRRKKKPTERKQVNPMFHNIASGKPGRSLALTALALILGGCGLGLLSLYFSAGEYTLHLFGYYLTQPMVLVLNLLPFVLLCLLFFFVSGRAWIGFLISGVVCLIFSWAQYWKLIARSSPIFAEDLLIVSEAVQMSGEYIRVTWQIVLSLVLVVLATVLLKRFCTARFPGLRWRMLLLALTAALCGWLYPCVYMSGDVYGALPLWDQLNQWSETSQYLSRGGIYPFLFSIQSAIPSDPEGYTQEQAEAILSAYADDDIPEERKVSVICVMYEAFADLSSLTDAITGADPYASFHALQEESYSGRLVTNIFAGTTIDTERRVLTGSNLLTGYHRATWSYARYFAGQGYSVNGAHAGYKSFYDRYAVDTNLGITDLRFYDGYYERVSSGIPNDEVFLRDVAEYCAAQMEEGPVFSYNVTYQNHGPYSSDQVLFTREYVPQEGLSSGDYHIINNYLQGIADTSEQMAAMADFFRDSDKPVVLVFFGDHKPWLGDQSATYQALGIDIFSEGDESFYNYYSTEYLIWANAAAKEVLGAEVTGTGPDISPCFLMNLVFQQCGWEGPAYQKLTDRVMEQASVLHLSGRYQVAGELLSRDQLPESALAALNDMRYVQYYLGYHAPLP